MTAAGALVIISHDLAVVSQMADELLVMRDGRVVERGDAAEVLSNPQHEYTRRLLDAVPSDTDAALVWLRPTRGRSV